MSESMGPGSVADTAGIREAVCIHTRKIFDSCKDKDCIEDLRVYLTRGSQPVVDRAISLKAGQAELLCAYIDVEPVGFNRGYYTVDVRFFYRVTADAFVGAARPVGICGLAVFDKRAILFGSEGSSKVFTSRMVLGGGDRQELERTNLPTAVVSAVDPIILNMKLVERCECRVADSCDGDIPQAISSCFSDELCFTGETKRVYVTLGQFSIIRLERDTQLLIPAYDYCVPCKECTQGCGEVDPCSVFQKVQFPMDEFFPPNTVTSPEEPQAPGCGCGGS